MAHGRAQEDPPSTIQFWDASYCSPRAACTWPPQLSLAIEDERKEQGEIINSLVGVGASGGRGGSRWEGPAKSMGGCSTRSGCS